MRSLSESIFSDDLIEKEPLGVLDEWLNTDEDDYRVADKYMELFKYLVSYNPKCPDNYFWNYTEKQFPKELKQILKVFKKIFIQYQKAKPMSVIYIDADIHSDMKGEVETDGIDDLATELDGGCWESRDGVYRTKRLDKGWIDAIIEYNEYNGFPLPDVSCPNYLGLIGEQYMYIVGFPKGTPDDILKIFRMK